jgi:hypothetical protein
MRKIIFYITFSFFLNSCEQSDIKQKELELKQKELEIKERELSVKEKDKFSKTENLISVTSNKTQKVSFITHTPCTFSVILPSIFDLQPMYDEKSPDYCDYRVLTKSGFEVMQLHTLLSSRFSGCDSWNENLSEVKNFYQCALNNSQLNISYKAQNSNWFVISGVDDDGDIVYWKRVVGNIFIGDLYIKYPKSRESEIVEYIPMISKSFTCK